MSDLSSSPLSQLSEYHQNRSKLISMLRHLYEKLLQIILQARLNTSQLTSQQDQWFNILYQVEPIQLDLKWMNATHNDFPAFLQPITVEIILSWKHLNDTKIYHSDKEIPKHIKSVVLEKWLIDFDTTKTTLADTKTVYKFACQFFRLLVATLKRLPAHNLLKSEKSKMIKRFGWHVTYNIYTSDQSDTDALPIDQKIDDSDEMLQYELPDIECQMGSILISLQYRSPANFAISTKSDSPLKHRKLLKDDSEDKITKIVQQLPDPKIQIHSLEDEQKVFLTYLGAITSCQINEIKIGLIKAR